MIEWLSDNHMLHAGSTLEHEASICLGVEVATQYLYRLTYLSWAVVKNQKN